MYVRSNRPVPVFGGFGAAGDAAVAAVGSVLRVPAGTLVNIGVWTFLRVTDPDLLAQGIIGVVASRKG